MSTMPETERNREEAPDPAGQAAEWQALGEARIEAARTARTAEDWERLFGRPRQPFPFEWGTCWKGTVQYQVDDFAAEVGFFVDGLGFDTNAFAPDFSVVPTPPGGRPTPPDAVRIGFMLKDVLGNAEELRRRGVAFTRDPAPFQEGAPMLRAEFATPNGIPVELWGFAEPS